MENTNNSWVNEMNAEVEAILSRQATETVTVEVAPIIGKWTEEQLMAAFKRLVTTKPNELNPRQIKFLGKAILCLYNRQTFDEQATESTSHQNAKGFNYFDAKPGGYMAQYLLSREDNVLSGKWVDKAHRMVKTYHRQICEALITGELTP